MTWFFPTRCLERSLITREPSPSSVLTPSTLPVYIWNLWQYPFCGEARSQTFIPNLVGFAGRYCLKDSLPLNATIPSSIDCSLLGL